MAVALGDAEKGIVNSPTQPENGSQGSAAMTTGATSEQLPDDSVPYDDLSCWGKLKSLQKSSSGCSGYVLLCTAQFARVWLKILYIAFSIVPILMIYFGAAHIKECPISNFIPIYMLIGGFLILLDQVLHWLNCRKREKGADGKRIKRSKIGLIFDELSSFWLILGTIFVYKIYEPNYDPAKGDYCHKTMYLFMFWVATICYASLIFALILAGCFCCFFMVCSKRGSQRKPDEGAQSQPAEP